MRNLIFAATSAAALTLLYCLSPQLAQADDMLAPFERSDRKWGFVNSDHCWVINPQFDSAGSFSEGLAAVELGDDSYRINKQGQILLDPTCVARP
jgi:hypothetical protein